MILLKNAKLLDANYYFEAQDVLIDRGYIQSVERSLNASCETIDLNGCILMPGLFDAHVHLCPARVPEDQIFHKENYKRWVQSGILGVRDMGLHTRSLDEFDAFQMNINHPDFPFITTYGPFIYAPGNSNGPFPSNTTAAEAAALVEQSIRHNVPGVKIMLNMESNSQTAEVVKTVAQKAQRAGIKSAAHIYVSADIELLLSCGISESAHSPMDRLPESLIQRMKEADITVVPTVANYYRMYRDGMLTKEQYDTTVENIGRCYRSGVRIGFGTDFMLTEDRPYIGYMIPTEEMRIMYQAGIPIQKVIESATQNSAYLCGVEHEMGTIERGKRAALIAVKAPLTEDFKALEDVVFVMNQGFIVKNHIKST